MLSLIYYWLSRINSRYLDGRGGGGRERRGERRGILAITYGFVLVCQDVRPPLQLTVGVSTYQHPRVVKLTRFFQAVPCNMNLPKAELLCGSLTPHRSVLINLMVATSILPVTGILPNLWSFLTDAWNSGEFGSYAPLLFSLSSSVM